MLKILHVIFFFFSFFFLFLVFLKKVSFFFVPLPLLVTRIEGRQTSFLKKKNNSIMSSDLGRKTIRLLVEHNANLDKTVDNNPPAFHLLASLFPEDVKLFQMFLEFWS